MKNTKRKMNSSELNMSAMIDIVFLLLIFFMCTTSFQKTEADLDTNLPNLGGKSNKQKPLDVVRLFIDDSGVKLNGEILSDQFALQNRLKLVREIDDLPIVIDGDNSVKVQKVVDVLNILLELRFSKISFGLGK